MADTNKRELETEPAEETEQQPAAKRQRPDEEPAAAATDSADAGEGNGDSAGAADDDMEGEEPAAASEEAAAEDDVEAQEAAAAAAGKKFEPFKLGYRTFSSPMEASAYIRRMLSTVRQDQPLNEVRGGQESGEGSHAVAAGHPLCKHAPSSSTTAPAYLCRPPLLGTCVQPSAKCLLIRCLGTPSNLWPPALQPAPTQAWPLVQWRVPAAADRVNTHVVLAAV
jgi:hypothetical protein